MIFSSWPGPTTDLWYCKFLSIVEHIIARHLDRKGGPAEASMPKQRKNRSEDAEGVWYIPVVWHIHQWISMQAVLSLDHSFFLFRYLLSAYSEMGTVLETPNWRSGWQLFLLALGKQLFKKMLETFYLGNQYEPLFLLRKTHLSLSYKVSNKYKCTSILGGSWTVRTSYFDLDFSFFFLFFLEASFCSGVPPCDALD